MPATIVTDQYAASAEEAWRLLGDFEGLDTYMDGITELTISGDARTFSLMGMRITEKLVSRDDADRSLTYAIVSGVPGVDSHQATVHVVARDAGCEVSWAVETVPAEAAPVFADAYKQALASLHAKLDG